MRILLFSPTGMVGSRLYIRLVEKKYEIECITRDNWDVKLQGNIDVCIYSAAITSARHESTEKYVTDNCEAALKVVNICKQYQVRQIIYLSSDEIYGNLYTESLNVDSDKINLNVYAMTKLLAENIIVESGINYCILRCPAIIDGSCARSTFLERMVWQMSQNQTVECSNQNRFFNNVVHVSDLCQFITDLLEQEVDNQIIHLGLEQSIMIAQILTYIKEKLNSNSEIVDKEDKCNRYFTMPIAEAKVLGYVSRSIFQILDELICSVKNRSKTKTLTIHDDGNNCIIDTVFLDHLKSQIDIQKGESIRYCLNQGTEDKVHEMINIYPENMYVRPHYHPQKIETKIVFEGELLLLILDEEGSIIEKHLMTPDRNTVIHLQPNVIHTNIPLTDVVFMEITPGPFRRDLDNIFVDKYPEDMDRNEVALWVQSLIM